MVAILVPEPLVLSYTVQVLLLAPLVLMVMLCSQPAPLLTVVVPHRLVAVARDDWVSSVSCMVRAPPPVTAPTLTTQRARLNLLMSTGPAVLLLLFSTWGSTSVQKPRAWVSCSTYIGFSS